MRHGHALALARIDVDHFKAINDTHGHQGGDEVLAEVARRLARAVRGGDELARWGGDEFVVILPATDRAGAGRAAERLRAAVAAEPIGDLGVTISVGWAHWAGDTPDDLLARADRALYRAKDAGRNTVYPLAARRERRRRAAWPARDGIRCARMRPLPLLALLVALLLAAAAAAAPGRSADRGALTRPTAPRSRRREDGIAVTYTCPVYHSFDPVLATGGPVGPRALRGDVARRWGRTGGCARTTSSRLDQGHESNTLPEGQCVSFFGGDGAATSRDLLRAGLAPVRDLRAATTRPRRCAALEVVVNAKPVVKPPARAYGGLSAFYRVARRRRPGRRRGHAPAPREGPLARRRASASPPVRWPRSARRSRRAGSGSARW